MTARLEFWFEFASTYSYPAAWRVEDAAREAGVAVAWRPFLLGPIFAAQGWRDSPFNLYPAKGRYMWRDLERVCDGLGLPFRRPTTFPRDGLLAARVACAHETAPWLPDFVRHTYAANFVEDRDIADPEVVGAILTGLDVPADAILAAARAPETKAKLRARTEEAVGRGLFGAPSFWIPDADELYWGHDRLEPALAHARRVEAVTSA